MGEVFVAPQSRKFHPTSARTVPGWPIRPLLFLFFAGALPVLRAEVSPPAVHAFIMHSGVNLPWIHYGWDLGANPWGGEPGGFHVTRDLLDADFATMKTNGIKVCRVFLFGDFRSALDRNEEGHILGLDPYVVPDMQALLDVALTQTSSRTLSRTLSRTSSAIKVASTKCETWCQTRFETKCQTRSVT